ncbi:hypothetical protein BK816_02490 [Boudabousia tangfeifanii]|uniref:Exonuclease domain-containing protein n=1 Tax=Boudabousia tangfeifanii TaxID=1912795 RepID=A0A1D9MJ26_9ACTO|nr:exonuclease domain-containing protein [Boudabousia tangfeifanii]AOZ72307.1 hypothetical protein BK816_02490 [Boudabousia tangfeifanii]
MNELAFTSWTESTWVGFDTETTGVNPNEDLLVTASLVLLAEGVKGDLSQVETANWLADPGVEIPEVAAQVHGISTEQARAEGRPLGEVCGEVAERIVDLWRSGAILVGFNLAYDIRILEHSLEVCGLTSLEERAGGYGPMVDPLVWDRKLEPYRRGRRNLETLCGVYEVSLDDRFHQADVDALATLGVLAAMVALYPSVRTLGREELTDYTAAAHQAWAEQFNRYLASQGRDANVEEYWP